MSFFVLCINDKSSAVGGPLNQLSLIFQTTWLYLGMVKKAKALLPHSFRVQFKAQVTSVLSSFLSLVHVFVRTCV